MERKCPLKNKEEEMLIIKQERMISMAETSEARKKGDPGNFMEMQWLLLLEPKANVKTE